MTPRTLQNPSISNELGRELELREVSNLIAAFGTPGEVAGRYAPRPNYLIGPGLHPTFLQVAKVMLGVSVGVPRSLTFSPISYYISSKSFYFI